MPPVALGVRFLVSAAVGLFAAFGIGALATPDQPRSSLGQAPVVIVQTAAPPSAGASSAAPGSVGPPPGSGPTAAPPGASATDNAPVSLPTAAIPVASFQLAGDDGVPAVFGVTTITASPAPAPPQPPNGTIQLLTYITWKDTGVDQGTSRPPWWNGEQPRVDAITQFDGGPFQNANCTLAAGSMLAHLEYGIVTTGSQLRGLQDDKDGGTSLYDLNTALSRGWGVNFTVGSVTPLEFRALIYGGAGAVLSGLYAEIPIDLRLQKNFTGGHAIYIDGFRPPSPDGPAAYYVIDPIGRPWTGYDGDWWPADVVERFATALGGGRISASWGFAGGITPTRHPVLPPEAYPTGTSFPTATPGPGTSAAPGFDPMPTGSTPPATDVDPGTTDPPEGSAPAGGTVTTGGGVISTDPGYCIVNVPRPVFCPPGLPGTVTDTSGAAGPSGPSGAGSPTTATGPPGGIPPWVRPHLLWATLIATGTYQLVYEVSPLSALDVWFWQKNASAGPLRHVTAEPAVVKGQPVTVATVTVDPTQSYSFVASGASFQNRALSELGNIVAGP